MHVFVTEIVTETFIGHDLRTTEALEITLGRTIDILLAAAWAFIHVFKCRRSAESLADENTISQA